jgi:L-glyceraldehyde 3-phosphate reductase
MAAYLPSANRYDTMQYRRSGRSGLKLPAISLGLWHNFGHNARADAMWAMCRRAFDLGITHFDLANNYGPPPGSAETWWGEAISTEFKAYRDELVISTKAGYLMWPGPYGEWGSRKYLLSSLDQSLKRMKLEYVDIFYSHRFDPDTPLEETMGALDTAVRQGKALYAGVSSYSSARTAEAQAILRDLGTPAIIHQPSYSIVNRWTEEDELLDTLEKEGMGCISFSPLAQGLLTDKYLSGVPSDSRAKSGSGAWRDTFLSEQNLTCVRALDALAKKRGQTLAQMAIAWVLRDPRMTSALIGASRVEQIEDAVGALANPSFTKAELDEIDARASDAGVNIWKRSSSA